MCVGGGVGWLVGCVWGVCVCGWGGGCVCVGMCMGGVGCVCGGGCVGVCVGWGGWVCVWVCVGVWVAVSSLEIQVRTCFCFEESLEIQRSILSNASANSTSSMGRTQFIWNSPLLNPHMLLAPSTCRIIRACQI